MPLLVASDLDNTLLDRHGAVTPRTRRAVERLRRAGGVFVAVTARPLRDAERIAREAGADGLVCSGGGVIFDPVRARIAGLTVFSAEEADRLVSVLRRRPGLRIGIDYVHRCELDSDFDLGWVGAAGVSWSEKVSVSAEPVIKLIVQTDSGTVDDLARSLRTELAPWARVSVPGHHFAEILPLGVDKASHLRRLAQASAGKSVTVAFGDMPGDLPMLEWADIPVAVANAHPAVLDAAQHVTLSHDQEGVALFIEQMLA